MVHDLPEAGLVNKLPIFRLITGRHKINAHPIPAEFHLGRALFNTIPLQI